MAPEIRVEARLRCVLWRRVGAGLAPGGASPAPTDGPWSRAWSFAIVSRPASGSRALPWPHAENGRLWRLSAPGPDESATDGPFSHIVRTFLTPHLRAARQKAGEDYGWTAFTEN